MITRPAVVCVSSFVVALVTDGVSATALTVIVAVTVLPPSPASAFAIEAWTCEAAGAEEVRRRRELQPGVAFANVMNVAVGDRVVPLFWNSVPLVMLGDLEVRHLRTVRRVAA